VIANLFRHNVCQECPYAKREAKLERRKVHAKQYSSFQGEMQRWRRERLAGALARMIDGGTDER
jgi:CRISPR/Cas system-associated endoribonuclease Cas2